jgi:hypothetical protein
VSRRCAAVSISTEPLTEEVENFEEECAESLEEAAARMGFSSGLDVAVQVWNVKKAKA